MAALGSQGVRLPSNTPLEPLPSEGEPTTTSSPFPFPKKRGSGLIPRVPPAPCWLHQSCQEASSEWFKELSLQSSPWTQHQGPKVVPHVSNTRKGQTITPLISTMAPGQLCGEVSSERGQG